MSATFEQPGRWIRQRVFALPYREVGFDYRGFDPCDPKVKVRIERYFKRFLDGYHCAVESAGPHALAARLDREMEDEFIGFAYEGAGMYLALLDFITPWKRDRLARFVAGPARRHEIITRIGTGLVFARLPWIRRDVAGTLQRLDPGLCWFAADGYGFHEGFFHHRRYIDHRIPPNTVSGYAAQCFDNGLGRSLWFVKGAAPEAIRDAIQAFPEARRKDLWAGIGLACAFAGGVHEHLADYRTVLGRLKQYCGPYRRELGLGVVFAADTRYRAGTPSPWTSLACRQLLNLSFQGAGRLAADTLETVREDLEEAPGERVRAEGYESARQKIMALLEELQRPARRCA